MRNKMIERIENILIYLIYIIISFYIVLVKGFEPNYFPIALNVFDWFMAIISIGIGYRYNIILSRP